MISRVTEILVAKSLGKPVVMFPNSVGPFHTIIGRSLSKLALNNCDFVLVREPISYDVVKSLRIRSPAMLTSDTTLIFEPLPMTLSSNRARAIVGVSPGVYSHSLSEKEIRHYISAHAEALDKAIEKYGFSAVFMPHYVSGFSCEDLEMCKLIRNRMSYASHTEIADTTTVEDFKRLINQVDMIISSKMHPAVFAASAYVPALCIAYDHKQIGFFMSLGESESVIPVTQISSEKLLSKIDYVWNNRRKLTLMLKKRVPELRSDVKKSVSLAIGSFIETP